MDIEVTGLDVTNNMLIEAAARGEDVRPAMRRIKALLIEGHKKQFESEGQFLGTPWPEDSPETLARKAREGIPSLGGVMEDSGDLRQALAGGKGSRTRVSRGSVSVGVQSIAALFTQGGASGGRRGSQPARPVLGIDEAERVESTMIIRDFLLGP